MTQRVVVVGATGRIGRPLCKELIRAGHDVVVFSRDPARARQLVPGAAGYVAWPPGGPAARPGVPGAPAALRAVAGGPGQARTQGDAAGSAGGDR